MKWFSVGAGACGALLLVASGCQTIGGVGHVASVQRWAQEVVTEGDHELVLELAADTILMHSLPSFPAREIAAADMVRRFDNSREQFPDRRIELCDIHATGDFVVATWTEIRTHTTEYRGYAPTGREYTYDGITIYRFDGGRIAEIWILTDQVPFYRLVGALPE